MILRKSILISLMLCMTANLEAQPNLGGLAGSPLRFGFGAAAIGMGNAVSALDGPDAVAQYNPALAPFQTAPSILAGSAFLSLDRSMVFLSYGTQLPPSAGISFSILRASVSSIQGRDRNGATTEVYSTSENAFGLSFGLRPSARLSLGVTARLLYAQLIEGLSSSTVGLDLGASYLVMNGLRGSMVFRDINSKYKWDTGKIYGLQGNSTVDRFPNRFILALGWMPEAQPGVFTVEAEALAGGWIFRTGAEIPIHEMITLRGGIDAIDPSKTLGTRLSAGMTVRQTGIPWNPQFDYAFLSEPYAPTPVHIITLRLRPKE